MRKEKPVYKSREQGLEQFKRLRGIYSQTPSTDCRSMYVFSLLLKAQKELMEYWKVPFEEVKI